MSVLKHLPPQANQGWKQRATQKDIALAAGVSQSTVSAVLRNDQTYVHFSQAAKEAVLAAAAQMNYRANPFARSMRSQRFLNLGLLLSHPEEMPYLPALVYTGVLEEASRRGYLLSLVYDPSGTEAAGNNKSFEIVESQVDGFIVYNSNHLSPALIKILEVSKVPYILANEPRVANCIVVDDFHAGKLATEHLYEAGYKAPLFVQDWRDDEASLRTPEGNPRFDAFCQTVKSRGQCVKSCFTPYPEMPEAIMGALRANPEVDSLVCSNDAAASFAQAALLRNGLRPGKDIGVIGFNGETMAELAAIPLTTMVIPWRKIGNESVSLICDLIADPSALIPPRRFQASLRKAESTER